VPPYLVVAQDWKDEGCGMASVCDIRRIGPIGPIGRIGRIVRWIPFCLTILQFLIAGTGFRFVPEILARFGDDDSAEKD
jgi:hypothetical protein